jgi:POT family proton-dependent oligopeptide transporter
MSVAAAPLSPAAPTADPNRHPRGLYALFFTELWERFSYYGMRALLVLYLVQYHGWQPSQASTVYKWYTSLVYLTPLAGGFLADRVIGLRRSIIAGGVLMALGHFALAFESMAAFYTGLGLLILGNGFFKPNISTTVGKMYGHVDPRRDRAFTIFYMGINIGALSPFICGALREHYGFHYGFAAAGFGMCVGLAIFLFTQRQVLRDVEAAGNHLGVAAKRGSVAEHAVGGAEEDGTPAGGAAGWLARGYPVLMLVAAVALPAQYAWDAVRGHGSWTDVLMPALFGTISGWMAITLMRIRGPARDKSTVIFVLFVFAVLFWMAFEQAGNALNLWAEFHTDLHLGPYAYPAEWFQTVNSLLIVLLAPVFAAAWTWLGKRGLEPSTPAKMLYGMALVAVSFAMMVLGAKVEERTVSRVTLERVPASIPTQAAADGRLAVGATDAGRLTFDPATHALESRGVLPRYVVHELLRKTSPDAFVRQVESLEESTRDASPRAPARVVLSQAPPGFALPFGPAEASERGLSWDGAARTLTATRPVATPTRADLAAAGAPPEWREPLSTLERESQAARVSGVWLFLSYLFATLGELCLSPVGLSMVTKLAPTRFASLFMGVWLLASSVAQYAGGTIGESWGVIPPTQYFMLFVWTSLVGAAVLATLVGPLRRLMHEVR